MKLIRNIIVAFSLYSRLPVPVFDWDEDDMKHVIVFLPLIGIIIGALSYGMFTLFQFVNVPLICRIALYSVIPLLVTGGFHVDGYMDVQDALKSYKSSEEKLEILKDPHIGAFAVIRLLIYSLIWISAGSIIADTDKTNVIFVYVLIFFIARSGCALSSLLLKHAKKTGMLNMETEKSTKTDTIFSTVQLIAGLMIACVIDYKYGITFIIGLAVHFIYYKKLCYSQFGGITGDTSGFYIVTLEEWLLVATAVMTLIAK